MRIPWRSEFHGPLRTLAPYLAAAWIRLIGLTSRVCWHGLEHVRPFEERGEPVIYAFWHQRQILFAWTHRGRGVTTLVSRSRDGELIAKALSLMPLATVRGSSSRGAASAARELLDLLAAGVTVAITPDGPKGPARSVKPGVLYLAQKSGRSIVPIANATTRRREFTRSWDRFLLPLPFSRISVRLGAPVRVAPGDDLAAKAAELERALEETTRRCEEDLR
ncbi:MAG: lysophospholipid acyltransferase family protein [Elusimicrobiota bacterium]